MTAQPKLLSTVAFIGGFVPPDYLIDGILQRRFIYSVTARPAAARRRFSMSIAASVDQGLNIGPCEVQRGRVLYLAGENPNDVRMRWLAQLEQLGLEMDQVDVHFCPPVGSPFQSCLAASKRKFSRLVRWHSSSSTPAQRFLRPMTRTATRKRGNTPNACEN